MFNMAGADGEVNLPKQKWGARKITEGILFLILYGAGRR